jgi:hypothetical protein
VLAIDTLNAYLAAVPRRFETRCCLVNLRAGFCGDVACLEGPSNDTHRSESHAFPSLLLLLGAHHDRTDFLRPSTLNTMTENASAKAAKDRKARKRETDRTAQREHRRRQKVYVQQLQEAVQDLSARQTRDERLDYLLAERVRLQELCRSLSSRLERVKQIAVSAEPLTKNEPSREKDSNETQPQQNTMLQTPATVASDGEECSVQPCEDYRPPGCTSEDQPDPGPVNNDTHAQSTLCDLIVARKRLLTMRYRYWRAGLEW